MIAFITIDNIDKNEPAYLHFKDKSQKSWNCTKPELWKDEDGGMAWGPGTHIKIDYNEGQIKPGFKYAPKYINNARKATADEANTWPDKQPYTGGGGNTQSSGGNVKKDNYDPEIGKRQTAANVSGPIVMHMIEGLPEKDKMEAFSVYFPQTADIVLDWVNSGAPKSESSGTSDASDPADEFADSF